MRSSSALPIACVRLTTLSLRRIFWTWFLTVSAPPAAALAFAEPQVRLAAREPEVAAPHFSVTPVSGPGRWALVLAGLAAAGWVAHRRLAFPY